MGMIGPILINGNKMIIFMVQDGDSLVLDRKFHGYRVECPGRGAHFYAATIGGALSHAKFWRGARIFDNETEEELLV